MKLASRSARRRTAAAALAAAALLGATGCSAVSPIATAFEYNASDGISGTVENVVQYRNLALVGAEDSGPARLIGSLRNVTDHPQTYTLTAEGGSQVSVQVQPDETLRFEDEETVLEREGVWVGENLGVTLSDGSTDAALDVPLLSATQDQYRELLPSGVTPSEEELEGHLHEETLEYGGGHH